MIPPFVGAILGLNPSRLLGPLLIGVAVLSVGGYVLWQRAEIAELSAERVALTRDRDTWRTAAEANEEAIAAIKAESARDLAAVAADRDAAAGRLVKLTQARKEVARAAQSQDAPPAGVLLAARGQLARLRADPAAPGGDRGQGREGDAAGGAPRLRP